MSNRPLRSVLFGVCLPFMVSCYDVVYVANPCSRAALEKVESACMDRGAEFVWLDPTTCHYMCGFQEEDPGFQPNPDDTGSDTGGESRRGDAASMN